jgi:hypothetical protein
MFLAQKYFVRVALKFFFSCQVGDILQKQMLECIVVFILFFKNFTFNFFFNFVMLLKLQSSIKKLAIFSDIQNMKIEKS